MPARGEVQRLDPVVAAAMNQLTDWTYHRYHAVHRRLRNVPLRFKGLRDPSSRSGAIHMLKNLEYHGYPVHPDDLRKWAIEHGWKASDARDLSAYAEGIRTGQRYHTVPDPFGHLAIDQWRDAAAKVD
jgi:hypothetical protein